VTAPVNHNSNKTSTFAALRNPVYRKLWFAVLLSGTCVAAHDTAATWTMNMLGSSTFLLSLMSTVASLPFFLFTPPAGVLADMVNRRSLTRCNTYRIELMVPSWTGYLLQRQRLTKTEQEIIKKVWCLHVGEQIPLERYYLCVNKELDAHQTREAPAMTTPNIPLHLGVQGAPPTS
jgi:Transmembrane secretion effector